jgi:hypothetical protein
MFCTQCGNEVEAHARFCSKCGNDVTRSAAVVSQASVVPAGKTPHDMNMHVTILGWLLIGSGILTAIGGTVLFFAGIVFRRMPIPIPPDVPMGLPPFLARIASLIGFGILVIAAGTVAAGVGLLQYRDWARVCAIIMAVLLVFHFPIGTAVAVYAFWVLFSQEGQQYYKSRSESTMSASGT